MGMPQSTPRIYCIAATRAPVVLVFRRGPTVWWHLMRWRVDDGVVDPGAWVHKRLYPRRCDLSPDGEMLLYFIAGMFKGYRRVYAGVSRVPWLHPLVQWMEFDTFGRGSCFHRASGLHRLGMPRTVGESSFRVTVWANDVISFVNERRRGWVEAPDCPARSPTDIWDEEREVVLQKSRKQGELLRMTRGPRIAAASIEGYVPTFEVEVAGVREVLAGVTWADWDTRGRMLSATSNALRIHEVRGETLVQIEEHQLPSVTPDPQPAPAWARAAPTTWGGGSYEPPRAGH
jgi:hypothetical protein